jgi:2-polyprenyl-3-methyl-5-hydroxy-6-metoxy-1,4-benzoquinol methylase
MAKVRDATRAQIERTGYWLIPIGPANRVTTVSYTKAEIEKLDADLESLGLNAEESPYFPSPNAVRGYLTPSRINSYHRVIEMCEAEGLTFGGKRVLEVGTGTGYLLRLLTDKIGDGSMDGCDYYEELARLSQGLAPAAKIVQGDIEGLKASEKTYDVVFCCESLEHILDTESSIPGLLGLVAPEGALVLTVPNCAKDFTPPLGSSDGNTFVGHVNFWGVDSWAFYISRMASGRRFATGVTGGRYADESLYAIIYND